MAYKTESKEKVPYIVIVIAEEEYNQAKAIVIEANRASVSLLQQRMRIGYNHASRMVDLLEKRGVIGPHRGAGPREVLVG